MSTFQFWLLAAALLLILIRKMWERWFRHWHVGFGAALDWKERDGTIWISSRLIGYPAWKHGINHPARLVSVNGTPMQFKSGEDFVEWFGSSRPKLGQEETWVVEKEGVATEVKMKPVLVTTSIPARWDPNRKPSTPEEEEADKKAATNYRRDPNFKTWPVFCRKTGDYLGTRGRLSDDALRRIIQ